MLRMLNNANLQAPMGYSHAVEASGMGSMLFVSGQVGVRADGSVPESVGEQAKLAVANVYAMLSTAGMEKANLAKVTIYLTDEAHLGEFMAAAGGTLPSPPPATTLLIVKALAAPHLFVEIEAVAVR